MIIDPPLEEVWQYNAGSGFGPGSPLIMGNDVFVATRKGEIHAIHIETGKKQGQKSFGDSIEGSPLIHDGILYVPVEWGGRPVQAYDLARANVQWRIKTVPIDAGLVLVNERLITADIEGYVRAYDYLSGEVLWENKLGDRMGVHTTPVIASDRLVAVPGDDGRVYGLDATDGAIHWTTELQAPIYDALASDGRLIFVPTTRGRFYAIDARTGAQHWQYAVADTTVRFTSPALTQTEVIFGGSDGILRSLAVSSGDENWIYQGDAVLTAAPLITSNTVYTGTMGREILGIDRHTGELRWSQELKGRIKSALAAKDGRIIVLVEPRLVYSFKTSDLYE